MKYLLILLKFIFIATPFILIPFFDNIIPNYDDPIYGLNNDIEVVLAFVVASTLSFILSYLLNIVLYNRSSIVQRRFTRFSLICSISCTFSLLLILFWNFSFDWLYDVWSDGATFIPLTAVLVAAISLLAGYPFSILSLAYDLFMSIRKT